MPPQFLTTLKKTNVESMELEHSSAFPYLKKTSERDICRRCGRCCFLKQETGDFVVKLEARCPCYGMAKDGKPGCTIYKDITSGMTVAPGIKCIDAKMMIEARLLPEDCAYTEKIPGYRSRVINW